MTSTLDRFTQRARDAVGRAAGLADEMNHEVIETGHLLIALYLSETSLAGHILRQLGISSEHIDALRDHIQQTGNVRTADVEAIMGTVIKQALDLAIEEAQRMSHHHIGTEHLLIGITRVGDPQLQPTLDAWGLDPEAIHHQMDHMLQRPPRDALATQEFIPPARPDVGNMLFEQFGTEFDIHLEVDGERKNFLEDSSSLPDDQFTILIALARATLMSTSVHTLTIETHDGHTIVATVDRRDTED